MAESEGGLNDALLKQLVCPVCSEYCTYPIYMCTNGHNVCHECVVVTPVCAVCAVETPYCRNLFAEETSAKITILCPRGCDQRFSLALLNEHLPECAHHTTYDCYVMTEDGTARCLWSGDSRDSLLEHVTESHPSSLHRDTSARIVASMDFEVALFNVRLFSAYDEVFWVILHYLPHKSSLFAYAYYIGLPTNAAKYVATFCFKSDDLQRNLTHKSLCYSYKNWSQVEELAVPLHKDTLSIFVENDQLACRVKISPAA